jgi:hypothetical protein
VIRGHCLTRRERLPFSMEELDKIAKKIMVVKPMIAHETFDYRENSRLRLITDK